MSKEDVSELRFPEFSGEFKEYSIDDLVKVVDCLHSTAPVSSEQTSYKMIRTGNVRNGNLIISTMDSVEKEVYEKWSSKGYLEAKDIILTREAPMGEVAIIPQSSKYNFFLGQRCLQLKVRDTFIDSEYMYLLLHGKRFEKYIRPLKFSGSTVSNIRIPELKKFKFLIPHLDEQVKVKKFLLKLNRLIELEEKKLELLEEQKKGYMQKIFSQELRFKDESGNDYPEWEKKKLGDIVSPLKGNNDVNIEIPIMTISAKRGWLKQQDRFSQVIAGNSLKNYTLLREGDLSYNKGNSKVAKYGIVYRLQTETALVPNVYKSFRVKEGYNSEFIEANFHNKNLDRQLRKMISSTARMDGLLNISDNDFYSIQIYTPTIGEQNKIADTINGLKKILKVQSNKYEALLKLKKGLLRKMFI
ncbi:restriction endonuclease subunit S [Salinicoccus sp. HZC-1]|uniref:restriction endonuclease subunit S n=1 Tax=Salinicoccus sp. HZC-1 TaxID=3385497 RepID=UPI00398B0C21